VKQLGRSTGGDGEPGGGGGREERVHAGAAADRGCRGEGRARRPADEPEGPGGTRGIVGEGPAHRRDGKRNLNSPDDGGAELRGRQVPQFYPPPSNPHTNPHQPANGPRRSAPAPA